MCRMHYKRWWKNGDPLIQGRSRTFKPDPCRVAGCANGAAVDSLCRIHHDLSERYGEAMRRPTVVPCEKCDTEFDVPRVGSVPKLCRGCAQVRDMEKQRERYFERQLWTTYRMRPADYEALLEIQGGACAICKGPPVGNGELRGRYSVEHNHSTGDIRGLLCSRCNTAIGLLGDDPERVRVAATYIESPPPLPGLNDRSQEEPIVSDRRVHGRSTDGAEIVRYDRAGRWFIEHPDRGRKRVTVNQAAQAAANGTTFPGLPGGLLFDYRVNEFSNPIRRRTQ